MQLPGRLSRSTLGDLLGALHRHGTTGLLELGELGSAGRSAADRLHRIHLEAGVVVGVETNASVPRIGEILLQRGAIDDAGMRRMRRRIAAGDARLAGEILVAEGLVGRAALAEALRAQVVAKIEALYAIDDAVITFHTRRPLAASDRVAGPLPLRDFLHGRPRLRDRPPPSTRDAGPPSSRRASFVHPAPRDEGEPRAPDSGRRGRIPGELSPDLRAHALRALGLSEGVDPSEVRRAFRRLAGELHPDRFANAPPEERQRRAQMFSRVSAAYQLLVA